MPSDAGATCAHDHLDAGVTTFDKLPRDVMRHEILGRTNLPEPADLGRLRAVSRGMRDAVDATGREVRKVSNEDAAGLGCVSLLKDRHSRGLLRNCERTLVCAAAARSGRTARGVEDISSGEFSLERVDVRKRGVERPPRGAAAGARERLSFYFLDYRERRAVATRPGAARPKSYRVAGRTRGGSFSRKHAARASSAHSRS